MTPNPEPQRLMKRLIFASALVVVLGAYQHGSAVQDTAAFITRLGADTLVVEQFTRAATRVDAEVVLRTPRTRVLRYTLEMTEAGSLVRLEATTHDPLEAMDAPPLRRQVVTLEGDSLIISTESDDGAQRRALVGHGAMLPFIDMVHWPFEVMLTRAYATGESSVAQTLFSGGRVQEFILRKIRPDSMTVQHPFRGTMGVVVDNEGRLLHLDASATTRKLQVDRATSADIAGLAARFAALDKAGRSFGALSGRSTTEATIEGATITVDYGTPAKRGRVIFGSLVPYGERWRTGANRATHFTTSKALRFGDLVVPAGDYTLSTIPEADESTLIINTQTGQGGTSYDPDRDLGRVTLSHAELDESVEIFRIVVEEAPGGGALRLQWDRTELYALFGVEE